MADQESWYDDAPITKAQYAGVWDSAMVVQEKPSYSKHIVRKLLAEIDRLGGELGPLLEEKRLRAVETTLRATIADEYTRLSQELETQLAETSADGAQWQQRAETAERDVERWNRAATLLEAGCITETAERDVERWNRAATLLEAGCIIGQHNVFETIAALTERAETAERELAELRERIGKATPEYGL